MNLPQFPQDVPSFLRMTLGSLNRILSWGPSQLLALRFKTVCVCVGGCKALTGHLLNAAEGAQVTGGGGLL